MNRLKEDSDKFKKSIKEKRIEYLIHFTPTINLYSILETGKIVSRSKLESLDKNEYDILDYAQFTDNVRYDDTHYINLSISHPNSFLFSKFQERTQDDCTIAWCILKIDPKYLYQNNTLFSVTNAASNAAKNQYGISGDFKKFEMLFDSELKINKSVGIRRLIRNNLHTKYPTDIQAEVLVRDEIDYDSILEICFNTKEELAQAKAAMCDFDTTKFVVDPFIFKTERK